MPERPKGADCKSAGIAYGGSNPSRPTRTSRNPLVTAGVLEHFLHDGDVQPAVELAADLALDPDLSESAGGV